MKQNRIWKVCLLMVMISMFPQVSVNSQQDDPYFPYELFTQTISDTDSIIMTQDEPKLIIKKEVIPEFPRFEQITIIELLFEFTAVTFLTSIIDITVRLNGFVSEQKSYSGNSGYHLVHESFILDDAGRMIYQSPMVIELIFESRILGNVQDSNFPYIDGMMKHIKIVTAPNTPLPYDEQIPIPVLSVPNTVTSSSGTSFFIIPATIFTNIVLPRNLNTSHYVNLTLQSNILLEYTDVVILAPNFQRLQGMPSPGNFTNTISFRVIGDIPEDKIVSQVKIQYKANEVPKNGISVQITGQWYLKSPLPNVLDPDEYDLPLFIISTTMPLLFLVKLPMNRQRRGKERKEI